MLRFRGIRVRKGCTNENNLTSPKVINNGDNQYSRYDFLFLFRSNNIFIIIFCGFQFSVAYVIGNLYDRDEKPATRYTHIGNRIMNVVSN